MFVPDADVIGAVDQGWKVAMATTSSERGLSLRSPGRFMATATRLIDLYHRYRHRSDPVLRDQVIQAWMDAQAYRWFTLQTVTRMCEGESIGPDSSMNKVFWSEWDIATHETALDLLGPDGELADGPDAGWLDGYLFSLSGPIYAGTNEIQRNVIGERLLGLPRGDR